MRRKDIVAYRENPFLKEHEIPMRHRKTVIVSGGKAVVDSKTGEFESIAQVVQIREVDSEQFIKVFTQNLRIFFSVSPVAAKIAQVLLHEVQRQARDNDRVLLNLHLVKEYFQELGMDSVSKSAFARGMKELLEKQFIAEHVLQGFYYINPHLFFNGDRARFVTEIRKKKYGPVQPAPVRDSRQMDMEEYLKTQSSLSNSGSDHTINTATTEGGN